MRTKATSIFLLVSSFVLAQENYRIKFGANFKVGDSRTNYALKIVGENEKSKTLIAEETIEHGKEKTYSEKDLINAGLGDIIEFKPLALEYKFDFQNYKYKCSIGWSGWNCGWQNTGTATVNNVKRVSISGVCGTTSDFFTPRQFLDGSYTITNNLINISFTNPTPTIVSRDFFQWSPILTTNFSYGSGELLSINQTVSVSASHHYNQTWKLKVNNREQYIKSGNKNGITLGFEQIFAPELSHWETMPARTEAEKYAKIKYLQNNVYNRAITLALEKPCDDAELVGDYGRSFVFREELPKISGVRIEPDKMPKCHGDRTEEIIVSFESSKDYAKVTHAQLTPKNADGSWSEGNLQPLDLIGTFNLNKKELTFKLDTNAGVLSNREYLLLVEGIVGKYSTIPSQYTFTINNFPEKLYADTTSTTRPTCTGKPDGTISLNLRGGTLPYKITHSDTNKIIQTIIAKEQHITLEGLSAHQAYNLEITDKNGCKVEDGNKLSGIKLSEPSQLLEITTSTVNHLTGKNKNDGIIQLAAIGGERPYTYLVDSQNTVFDKTNTQKDNGHFKNLTAGTYQIGIKDANNCIIRPKDRLTVEEPDSLKLALNHSEILCHGDKNVVLKARAIGGWRSDYGSPREKFEIKIYRQDTATNSNTLLASNTYGDSSSISNLGAGHYKITVEDAQGNSYTEQLSLIAPDPLRQNPIITAASCSGKSDGSLRVSATGGRSPYTFEWLHPAKLKHTGNSTGLDNLSAGDYQLKLTDSNGCELTAIHDLREPTALSAIISTQDISCHDRQDGQVRLVGIGGTPPYKAEWGNGESTFTLTGLTEGSYVGTLYDSKGCQSIASGTIHRPSALRLDLNHPKDIQLCFNPHFNWKSRGQRQHYMALVDSLPGVHYRWYHNNNTHPFSNKLLAQFDSEGQYTLEAYRDSTCKVSDYFYITHGTDTNYNHVMLNDNVVVNQREPWYSMWNCPEKEKCYDSIWFRSWSPVNVVTPHPKYGNHYAEVWSSEAGMHAIQTVTFYNKCIASDYRYWHVLPDTGTVAYRYEGIKAYPNPNRGIFHIEHTPTGKSEVEVSVFDVFGYVYNKQRYAVSPDQITVLRDVNVLQGIPGPGLYVLYLESRAKNRWQWIHIMSVDHPQVGW